MNHIKEQIEIIMTSFTLKFKFQILEEIIDATLHHAGLWCRNKKRGKKRLSNVSTTSKTRKTSVRCAAKRTQNKNISSAFQKKQQYVGKPFQSPNTYTNQSTFSSHVMFRNQKKISSPHLAISHGCYSSQSLRYTTNFVPNFTFHPPISTVRSPSQQTSTPVRRNFNVVHSSQPSQQRNSNSVNWAPNNSNHVKSLKTENVYHKGKNKNKNVKRKIDINAVVRELGKCEGFFCFLSNLSQKLNINGSELLKVLKENNHVFSTLNDPEKGDSLVELCPKLELCDNHQQDGCIRKICSQVHLCEDFVYTNCIKKDCPLGHMSNFKSDHNLNILKKYYISTLPNTSLRLLFQKVCTTIPTLNACLDYYQGKCKLAEKCKNLHICYSYVNTLGFCALEDCTLSHDIRDVKISLGLSSNECPRDILKVLKDKCIDKANENYLKETSKTPIVENTLKIGTKDKCIEKANENYLKGTSKTPIVKNTPEIGIEDKCIEKANNNYLKEISKTPIVENTPEIDIKDKCTEKAIKNYLKETFKTPIVKAITELEIITEIGIKDKCIEKTNENYLKETSKTPIVKNTSEIGIKNKYIEKANENYLKETSKTPIVKNTPEIGIEDKCTEKATKNYLKETFKTPIVKYTPEIGIKDKCIEKTNENYLKETSKTPIVENTPEIDIKDCQIHENKNVKKNTKSLGANQQTELKSVHCTDFYGSVESTKICLDGIKLNCELTDCPFFHCFHKSHWQFGNGDKWYNFDEYHSQILDSTYSDPNCEGIFLPKLDFSRLNTSQIGLIKLLGEKNLEIDFNKMTLFCESTDKTYYIWNLTTESSVFANEDDDIENFTVFKWYFQDDDKIWNIFDNSDSSSLLLEKDYFQCPDSITMFTSTKFSYLIDFDTMTQENETTYKKRPLRRRPYIQHDDNDSTDSKKDECKEIFLSPQTSEDLNNKTFELVKLSATADEYVDIHQKLLLSLPLIKRIKVWRIHNTSQWEIFTKKYKALEQELNSEFLNVQELFHGIDLESAEDAVKENLEHLRHGTSSGSPLRRRNLFLQKIK
ncbi:Poly [ADP-ribose] polymerase 12 [Armadillidium vulgare]|nr:Poly [ADP-ribose] polymerase 12 [Armadillidium vulgare]